METQTETVVSPEELERNLVQIRGSIFEEAQVLAVIKTQEDRTKAALFGVECAKRERGINAEADKVLLPIEESKRKAEAARKAMCALRDAALIPVNKAKEIVSKAISGFDAEQKRLARIAQEEADRKAREEHERQMRAWKLEQDHAFAIAEDAERDRLKKEASERAEFERKKKEEEDFRLAHAEEAKKQGNGSKVETILEQKTVLAPTPAPAPVATVPAPAPAPVPLPPPPPPPAPTPVLAVAQMDDNGARGSEVWDVRIADPIAIFRALADKEIPLEYTVRRKGKLKKVPLIEINEGLLRSLVKKLKNEFAMPGVESYKEQRTAFYVPKEDEGDCE